MCWWRGAVWCVRSFPSFSGYAARWWEPSPPRKTVSGLVHNGTSVVRFYPKYVSHDVCAFEGSFEGNPSWWYRTSFILVRWRARLNVLTWNTSLASSYSLWSKCSHASQLYQISQLYCTSDALLAKEELKSTYPDHNPTIRMMMLHLFKSSSYNKSNRSRILFAIVPCRLVVFVLGSIVIIGFSLWIICRKESSPLAL